MTKIPGTPNINNEPAWTIEQAVSYLPLPSPLPLATLSKLGKEASLAARAMRRPTGVVATPDKPWPTEKSYTRDVLAEVFRLNPATADVWAENQRARAALQS